MQYFNIEDSRADSCDTCCCQAGRGKPGETDKWVLNYAPVVVPSNSLALVEGTCFNLEPTARCESGCPSAALSPLLAATPEGEEYVGALAPQVDAPEGATLAFEPVAFYGPRHGRLALAEDGSFTYTPRGGFTGLERFFWEVSINGGTPAVQEVVINVGGNTPTEASLTPLVRVVNPALNNRQFTLTFGVQISPAAAPGDSYRLEVRQSYKDCDACYTRTDCFDLSIGACR